MEPCSLQNALKLQDIKTAPKELPPHGLRIRPSTVDSSRIPVDSIWFPKYGVNGFKRNLHLTGDGVVSTLVDTAAFNGIESVKFEQKEIFSATQQKQSRKHMETYSYNKRFATSMTEWTKTSTLRNNRSRGKNKPEGYNPGQKHELSSRILIWFSFL